MGSSKVIFGFAVAVLAVVTFVSCNSYPTEVTDPQSKTSGYKLFTGATDGFPISFEYPNGWSRMSIDKGATTRHVRFLSSDCAVVVNSFINKSKGGDYANADELIQYKLSLKDQQPEFEIVRRTMVRLDQTDGEEAIYSYLFEGSDPHAPPVPIYTNDPAIAWIIDADYKDRICDLNFISKADNFEVAKLGFEHLIATFSFLQ